GPPGAGGAGEGAGGIGEGESPLTFSELPCGGLSTALRRSLKMACLLRKSQADYPLNVLISIPETPARMALIVAGALGVGEFFKHRGASHAPHHALASRWPFFSLFPIHAEYHNSFK